MAAKLLHSTHLAVRSSVCIVLWRGWCCGRTGERVWLLDARSRWNVEEAVGQTAVESRVRSLLLADSDEVSLVGMKFIVRNPRANASSDAAPASARRSPPQHAGPHSSQSRESAQRPALNSQTHIDPIAIGTPTRTRRTHRTQHADTRSCTPTRS